MTANQQRLIEENYNLVNAFLRKRGYSPEQYYDAAVDGLIRAAEVYSERPTLQVYRFSTIAYRQMDDKVRSCMVKECRRQRIAQMYELEKYLNGNVNLNIRVDDASGVEESIAEKLLYAEMAAKLTKKQAEVFYLKVWGYSGREMAERCSITTGGIYSRTYRMRRRLRKLLEAVRLSSI